MDGLPQERRWAVAGRLVHGRTFWSGSGGKGEGGHQIRTRRQWKTSRGKFFLIIIALESNTIVFPEGWSITPHYQRYIFVCIFLATGIWDV